VDVDELGTDAQKWTDAFVERFDGIPVAAHPNGPRNLDQGTLLGWFANAIEAGRRAGRAEALR
jgi:hypothetical protein